MAAGPRNAITVTVEEDPADEISGNQCEVESMMKNMIEQLPKKITLLFFFLYTALCAAEAPVYAPEADARIPRTEKPFLNDPEDFQFVVVGDRTGGHRPGVFVRAMDQINLLRPEFVVSVGDLVEGYTHDRELLASQWEELDAAVDKLDMPFFYTVGNHDMSNNLMRELWHHRLGKDYYYFVYRGVLFISLNTEDPPVTLPPEAVAGQTRLEAMMREDPVATQQRLLERSRASGNPPSLPGQANFSRAQLDFVRKTLNDNKEVRWTVLLMHKPAWQYASQEFEQIEHMLRERDYTVIAGHEHYYLYTSRHGRDYVDMGTTGGIWLRDGPGRSDHIAWVTMTDRGPVFANIRLDGLSDKRGLAHEDDREGQSVTVAGKSGQGEKPLAPASP